MKRLVGLVPFLGLLLLCSVAYGGHYAVSFSGGSVTRVFPTGVRTSKPFTQVGATGYEVVLNGSYDETVYIDQGFTVTFTWTPYFTGDVPPKNVVLTQGSRVTVHGNQCTVDNGIGGASETGLGAAESRSEEFEILTNPPTTFTRTINPVGIGDSSSPGMGFNSSTSLFCQYSAVAAPVTVTLTGVTYPNNSPGKPYALVGQRIQGKLVCNAGGLGAKTITDYDWNVAGEIFDRWERGDLDSTATLVPIPAANKTATQPKWVWLRGDDNSSPIGGQPGGASKVSVNATLKYGSRVIGTISAEQSVNVVVPASKFEAEFMNSHIFRYTTPGDYTTGKIFAEWEDGGEYYADAFFSGRVSHPGAPFASTGHSWLFVQTLTTKRTVSPGPLFSIDKPDPCLDESFPYSKDSDTNPGGPFETGINTKTVGDNPRQGLGPGNAYNIHDNYLMTLMFLPKDSGHGSEYVPLKAATWKVQFVGSRLDAFTPWPNPTTRTVARITYLPAPNHPVWGEVLAFPN